jgi:DNA-binding transcriptional LysR family regulator
LADELGEMKAFAAVARAGGFREAARVLKASPSGLSEAVRRLERRLGVRLLHRTTRSVLPTEQGQRLLDRALPAFAELEHALKDVASSRDQPAGILRLNVPTNAARLFLPIYLSPFLKKYPGIRVEVTAQTDLVDVLSAGCDAGVRYDDRLEQDMIAVPIGPRRQRFATAASPAYLDAQWRPEHPRDLMKLDCLRGRFSRGNLEIWEYEQNDEIYRVEPEGQLIYSAGTGADLGVDAAVNGLGVIYLFEDWLRPFFDRGELEPVLQPWWQWFTGPYLYYPGRQLVPPPLRAFIDFVKAEGPGAT